jgi:beta-lactam-binding protein with PASTA domain
MASRTFKFTHASNSVFETRVTLTDGVLGRVSYTIELYNTSPSSWQSFNLFGSGPNAALCNINIGSRNFNKNYTYDWKYSTTQNVRRTIRSSILRDLAALQFRVGMSRQSGVGIPAGASITATSTANSTVTMSVNATSSGTSSATFARAVQPASLLLFSGTLDVTPGSVISLSGSNDCKSTIGNATASGSFTAAAPPTTPAPSDPPNVVIDVIGKNNLRLNWDASSGVVNQYRVYLNGSGIATTTSTVYDFTGLSSNTSYTLGVRAEGPDNVSSIVSVSATTLPDTFTVPNVGGQLNTTAVTNLINAGFGSVSQTSTTSGATQANNRTVVPGSQSPVAGTTATQGDSASIQVYSFERPVPNIVGLTRAQAEAALQASQFSNFSSTLTTSGATLANNKLVATQNPGSGTSRNILDSVTFQIYDYRIPVPNLSGLTRSNALATLNSAGFTNVTSTTTETGATAANNNRVFSQSPVNSATTYNPVDQAVSFVVYTLGVVGKKFISSTTSELLTTSARFDGTEWIRVLVAKRFNGTSWQDIT